jgi:DNA-binding XRE family transcriptional regulator
MEKTNFEIHREEILSDPESRKSYEEELKRLKTAHRIAELRRRRRLTQKQLAELLNTSQSVIARIENGGQNISVNFLCRIAWALSCKLEISLKPTKTPKS